MNQSIIKRIGAKQSQYFTAHQFLKQMSVYEIAIGNDFVIYFSQCDFKTGEDLRPKELIDLFIDLGSRIERLKISESFILEVDNPVEYIKKLIKPNNP